MRVRFCLDNGANINSKRYSGWYEVAQLGFTEEEWNQLSEDDKYYLAEEEMNQHIEIWFDEYE